MRKGVRGTLVAALAMILVAAGPGMPVTAAAATNPVVRTGAVFNRPGGSDVRDKLVWLIDGTKSGGAIRLSTFLFGDKVVASRLIAAAWRGVKVQVIADHQTLDHHRDVFNTLRAALLLNPIGGSWAKLCRGGCIGYKGSAHLHSKFALFSNTRHRSKVTFITTANLTGKGTVGGMGGWNSAYTQVGNPGLYGRMSNYFTALDKAHHDSDYYHTKPPKTIKKVRTAFHPRETGNTYKEVLEGVNCKAHATVWVDTWRLSDNGIATTLNRMSTTGCRVRIVVTEISREACILLTSNHSLEVVIRGYAGDKHGTHGKNLTIAGEYLKKKRYLTFTGSANLNPSSLRENDELIARIEGKSIYRSYTNHIRDIWRHAPIRDGKCRNLAT